MDLKDQTVLKVQMDHWVLPLPSLLVLLEFQKVQMGRTVQTALKVRGVPIHQIILMDLLVQKVLMDLSVQKVLPILFHLEVLKVPLVQSALEVLLAL